MYIITKNQVATFKALAGSIKTDDRNMPILQYLLFTFTADGFTVLKNGLKSYLQQFYDTPSDATRVSILIEEKVLYSVAENAPTDEIEIIPGLDTVLLRSVNWEMTSATEPVDHYPVAQAPAGQGIILSPENLKQIGIAAGYTADEEIPTPRGHVFAGAGYIAGSDAAVGYLSPCREIEGLVLRKEVAAAISSLPGCEYVRTGNYDIFKTLNTNLGFIMPDTLFFNLSPLVQAPAVGFTLEKADLVRFCTAAVNVTPSKLVLATMERVDNGVMLRMHDAAVNKKLENVVHAEGGPAAPFKFNVNDMLRFIKPMPDGPLAFAPGKQRYYCNGAGYTALIMALVN